MKRSSRFFLSALIGASLPLVSSLRAAETDPVGAVSVEVAGGGALTLVSVPLRQGDVFSGVVGELSGSVVSLEGAAFEVGEFASQESPHFLFVREGEASGSFFLVEANDSTSVTVDARDLSLPASLSVGDFVQIVPGNTLSTIFGFGSDLVLDAGDSSSSADNVIVWDGLRWQRFWVRSDGNWYSNQTGRETQNHFIIYPDEGFFIRNVGPQQSFVFTGSVPLGQQLLSVAGGNNLSLRTHQFPVDVTFAQLGLQDNPGWAVGNSSSDADQIILWTGERWQRFWVRGDGFWYSNQTGREIQDDTPIPAGSSFFVMYGSGPDGIETSLFTQSPYNL